MVSIAEGESRQSSPQSIYLDARSIEEAWCYVSNHAALVGPDPAISTQLSEVKQQLAETNARLADAVDLLTGMSARVKEQEKAIQNLQEEKKAPSQTKEEPPRAIDCEGDCGCDSEKGWVPDDLKTEVAVVGVAGVAAAMFISARKVAPLLMKLATGGR